MSEPASFPQADDVRPDSRFREFVGRALAAWRQRGRLADLLGPILEWTLGTVGAERAILFTLTPGGGYRVRASRDTDGDAVRDAERWISTHMVRRTLDGDEIVFFADTLRDRRFRTEAELESGARIRSMLAYPIVCEDQRAILYADSRFKPMECPAGCERDFGALGDLIAAGLRHDALDRRCRALERKVTRLARAQSAPLAAARPAPVLRTGLRKVDFHGFRTCCPELLQSIDELQRLARSTIPVLIEGESGTGKEVLARAIHVASGREGRFVSLHCGAIPEALVEIELFGHVRGAFTGAEKDRVGLFEHARGGTIFLDDVGEMTPEMQVALLRVLETGRFRPVSAEDERVADVRVISASLTSPGDTDDNAGLRADLYYRLAGATVSVPPLRDRREDTLPLAQLFVERHGSGEPLQFAAGVEGALLSHDWPGNVRELENLLRRVIAIGDHELTLARFEEIIGASVSFGEPGSGETGTEMQAVVDRAEREAIIRALLQAAGNKSLAAKLLGLSRKTLYRRMEKHGIPL